MKKLVMLISAAMVMLGAPAFAADATAASGNPVTGKVAVVNVQQILQQSPRVAELSKKLEGQFKERQQKIADNQKKLQDDMEKFKKDSPTLAKKDRDTTEKKLNDQRNDLMKQVVSYQQDVNKEQSKIMQGILSDLNKIVMTIAKNEKYPLVLEAGAVVYAESGNDITAQVSKKFNDQK